MKLSLFEFRSQVWNYYNSNLYEADSYLVIINYVDSAIRKYKTKITETKPLIQMQFGLNELRMFWRNELISEISNELKSGIEPLIQTWLDGWLVVDSLADFSFIN